MDNNIDTSEKIALFLGGGQSGKSFFAENCAKKWENVLFYATGGQIENSPEWDLRVKKHRERRPGHWTTIEYPIGLEEVIKHCQDNKYDVLLSPTLSHPAPPIGHYGPNVDTLEVIFRLNSYVNFTTLQNITGAPAISLPMGMSKDRLPIGIQFAANVGEEAKLLSLAFEVERVNKFLKINEF